MAADVLEYPDIAQEVKGAMNGGRLKLSKQGILFKNNKTGIVEQLHAEDIEVGKWLRAARGYELKLFMKNESTFKYDGFKDTDREDLANFLKKHYSVELEDVELCIKGWNWGQAQFSGSELDFKIGSKTAFNVPLGNVSHTTTGKNEVILEFHQNDDAEVSLMEMRFYIPPSENGEMSLEKFYENVMAKADIIQATGDAITSLDQIPCLTPRGRYDIKIFPTFLQLHGKTFDYKIPYTTVLRLFLLPHKDQRQMLFVVSLDPPIVQGQTRYHFLIMSFSKEETISLDLNIAEEDLEQKYEGKLQKEMAGPIYEIVSRLMKALVARKITVPGSFRDSKGHQAITCSYKSNSGYLYPLERGFMYVHKPPIHVRFDEVSCVNFARGTGSSRYFDFEIERKNGDVFVFSSIEKDDYSPLFEFVNNKKLRVKNRGMKSKDTAKDYDELFDSDDENTHDAYLEQMKAEGREKVMEDDEGDSDSSSDEDFNPDESASDVAEEYDSNPSPSSGSDSGGSKSDEEDQDYVAQEGDKESDGEKPVVKKKKEKKEKKEKVSKVRKPRKKKKKDNEDPDKPKRPPSAYMLWLNETRPELKAKYPDFGVADIAKKAGELWNKLDNQDEWKEKAAALKEKYNERMKEYNENRPPPEKKSKAEKEKKSKTEKKSSKKKPSPSTSVSPKKQGSFKSKEYISSEDSSASEPEGESKSRDDDDEDEEETAKKSDASEEEEAAASDKEDEKEDDDEEMEEDKDEENEEEADADAEDDDDDDD
ncbi:FACT complex subunit SSRP1 [Holothuria leucospilota]|uniref:FACT complex subunit SSRP1 n=1 Tax=Holothuria leucospilota TaxID=206669 RepID=A0A9Q1CE24_HOLLE|nr:FACT complex subunit SSRP1 [Holothuria leucospilota]